jgi:hypothetical protein
MDELDPELRQRPLKVALRLRVGQLLGHRRLPGARYVVCVSA